MAERKPLPDKETYIATLLAYGRPEVLRIARWHGISAGRLKDTREICALLYRMAEMNVRKIG
jgi:hypothetical protein